MAGPYPQYSDPLPGQPSYTEPYPGQHEQPPGEPAPPQPPAGGGGYPPGGGGYPPGGGGYPPGYPPAAASVYPGMLPPPVPYPRRRRLRLLLGGVLAVVLVAAATVAIVFAVHSNSSSAGGQLTSTSVKSAIQGYLDALANGDTETVARNTLCGMYDAVRDRRSDQALARLSSDAFRKQFSKADVTSIDKIVFWSPNQAQVLFTMRVTLAARSAQKLEEQAIAQLLVQDNHILVCSYLLRTAAAY